MQEDYPQMLGHLRQLNARFGTRAVWIELGGKTVFGRAPQRVRVIPTIWGANLDRATRAG